MTANKTQTTAKPLTWLQEAFCQAYVDNAGNGTKAAKKAGYKGADNTLATVARDNTRKHHIKARIEALQAKTRAETEDRREKRLKNLDTIIESPDTSTRDQIQAITVQGKMCGWHSETRILETRERQIQLSEAQKAVAARTSLLLLDTKRLPDGSYGTEPPETCNINESTPGE